MNNMNNTNMMSNMNNANMMNNMNMNMNMNMNNNMDNNMINNNNSNMIMNNNNNMINMNDGVNYNGYSIGDVARLVTNMNSQIADMRVVMQGLQHQLQGTSDFAIRESGEATTTGINLDAYNREVARTVADLDSRGCRNIPPVLTEASMGFVARGSNRTPSSSARINALINYLWKRLSDVNRSRNVSEGELNHIRTRFNDQARNVIVMMRNDGVTETFWSKIEKRKQLYYAFKLEGEILRMGYKIFQCEKQWAAMLLLQERMKGQRHVVKVRIHLNSKLL
ncbi:unnamed protein product [Mucor hiemalis]